ncbi:thiamine diphosphokinase [Periweissella beninensis]|uniref:Thiamine diphosphokinase n=1 Tax=Periweissella beninensis TaxID=504936 RepID=A0ABT0VF22_9LACO|nr:thiamine diphosphokinase [Periweissella beninensis]MBM7543469.1 thiamine pyrophosphokinase [Periweissella beninensis]MCM2436452.1 thiamine diphosphokinase [Periweissella beninensis]MCT4396816.1 thiamine diphosphokinase [Periweissella beninensis]
MKSLNILLGGPIELLPDKIFEKLHDNLWLGVDRGALRLLKHGIYPQIAVGDFDSVSTMEHAEILTQLRDIRQVKPEKDETDFELALKIALAKFSFEELHVYGATGGRLDHFLSNIWVLTQTKFTSLIGKIKFYDRGNTLSFYLPGEHSIQKETDKRYLGFMNLTPVSGLTLIDEKYHLKNWHSNVPFSWSSNEFVGTTNHFKFETGIILVIQSKDTQKI